MQPDAAPGEPDDTDDPAVVIPPEVEMSKAWADALACRNWRAIDARNGDAR